MTRSPEKSEKHRAEFSYSSRNWIAWTFLALALIPASVYYTLGSPTFESIIWFVSVDSLVLFAVVRSWADPIRKVYFFEDHMHIAGRMPPRDVSYSVITVELRTNTVNGSSLIFHIEGDEKPLAIYKIPKSKQSRVDLYSWLKGKVKESVGPLPGKIRWF